MRLDDEVQLLIKILFDPIAREDERHDAAMDMGKFNDDKVLNALMQVGSNTDEEYIVLDACGESIAKILVGRNEFRQDIIYKLAPIAQRTAIAFFKSHKPEWKFLENRGPGR